MVKDIQPESLNQQRLMLKPILTILAEFGLFGILLDLLRCLPDDRLQLREWYRLQHVVKAS
ncbi:hypothetical protein D3C85_1831990 [compost metagenome]